MHEEFDAVVVGAGQGGIPLARAIAGHGWKTALVERRLLGGVCTNDGCTPTKTMVASARVAALARRGEEFGIETGHVEADMRRVAERANALAVKGRQQIERALSEVQGLEVIYGEGSFAEQQSTEGRHAVEVKLPEGASRVLIAPRVFLDTGVGPQPARIDGLAETSYLDSSSILHLEDLPGCLVILGGGYIAVEFAQMFRRFGAEVVIVERGPHVLAGEDEDLAACMEGILRDDGVEVLCGAEVHKVGGDVGAIELTLTVEARPQTVRGTHLLIATGRVPNTESLRVERVGVALTENNYIKVNEQLETGVTGIWALGDVTGGPPYTHASYDDFRILRENLLRGGSRSTKDRVVPYCIFTDPELGRVGLSERQARAAGMDFHVATAPMSKVARALESGETRGMMKAIVERGSGRLLGAAVLAVNGGEMITQLQLAMMGHLTADHLKESLLIHPVLAEGFHVLFASYRHD